MKKPDKVARLALLPIFRAICGDGFALWATNEATADTARARSPHSGSLDAS